MPTGDPRLDDNPFFNDHMQGAVEKQLVAKGLELSSAGTPDLLIHYHANVMQRIDVNRVDREYRLLLWRRLRWSRGIRGRDAHPGHRRQSHESGGLAWLGTGSFEGVIDNRDRLERMINRAVAQMLARFPPPV